MRADGRLLFDPWWLDDRYRYNMVPFRPKAMHSSELQQRCLEARRSFYSWRSIARRGAAAVNRQGAYALAAFTAVNALHQWDVETRSQLPLGDETWHGQLLPAR